MVRRGSVYFQSLNVNVLLCCGGSNRRFRVYRAKSLTALYRSWRHQESPVLLQCVAACCSVLQCVTACCSVLQHAAVCCSVLHRSRRRLESREVSHLCGYVCVRVCVRVCVCVCVCVCVQMCVLDSMPAALSREQRGAPF